MFLLNDIFETPTQKKKQNKTKKEKRKKGKEHPYLKKKKKNFGKIGRQNQLYLQLKSILGHSLAFSLEILIVLK